MKLPDRFNLKEEEYLGKKEKKSFFTLSLFDQIAPVYEKILGGLTLFQDGYWKRHMIKKIKYFSSIYSLEVNKGIDFATGTGDIIRRVACAFPQAKLIGSDISKKMLTIAQSRNTDFNYAKNIVYKHEDMGSISSCSKGNYSKGEMDLVTGGYALRNSPDLDAFLSSVYDMLKPGGIAAFVDFSRPNRRIHLSIQKLILSVWLGFWSFVIHRNPNVYLYIPRSLDYFPNRKKLEVHFIEKGFKVLYRRVFMFGVAEVNILRK